MESQELILSLEDAVGRLVLNRPQFHNAINRNMWDALPGALDSLRRKGARVIVITGSGNSFASGADLSELKQIDSYASASAQWQAIRQSLDYVYSFELPTVAMIRGSCLGGGCLLALACDLRFASQDAQFGIPVARLGIVLDETNILRLISIVGGAATKEILYRGSTISSTRALEIGLVNAVTDGAALKGTVDQAAAEIVSNAADSLKQMKASVNRLLALNALPDQEAAIRSYLADEFRLRIRKNQP